MNHEQVAREWAEAYIKGTTSERWHIAENAEENGVIAALIALEFEQELRLSHPPFTVREQLVALCRDSFLADMKAIAAGDDPPTSPACPEAMKA